MATSGAAPVEVTHIPWRATKALIADALAAAGLLAADAAPVTVSVGVATIPENALDAERLLAAADSALYEAKRTGRDRVAASGREPVVSRRTA